MVHISSNNGWKEVRGTDDAGIILVSNYSAAFANRIFHKRRAAMTGCRVSVSLFVKYEVLNYDRADLKRLS